MTAHVVQMGWGKTRQQFKSNEKNPPRYFLKRISVCKFYNKWFCSSSYGKKFEFFKTALNLDAIQKKRNGSMGRPVYFTDPWMVD